MSTAPGILPTDKKKRNKNINIEKYDFAAFEKEHQPYVMITRDLIQKFPISKAKEYLVWSYLQSLPETWVPSKRQLMQHFDLSERNYQRYMAWLNRAQLIEYRQIRGENGVFGKLTLVVLNGLKFNPDADSFHTAKFGGTVKTVQEKNNLSSVTAPPKNRGAVNTAERLNGDDINTRSLTKKNNIKETNTPPIPPEGGGCGFDVFWELYPKKKGRSLCEVKWKQKKLDAIADEIINKLKDQIALDDEWLRGYAPNPSTYISQARWEDEISKPRPSSNTKSKQIYDDNDTSWINGMVL